MDQAALIENIPFDEIQVGQSARLVRQMTLVDVKAFAAVSGDVNPSHLDAAYADASRFHGLIGHGMWGGAIISTLLGTELPGPGTVYLAQTLQFHKPVRVGDTLCVSVTVRQKDELQKSLILDCLVTNQHQETV
ncbi:MAG: MaoC/PaaZ C-terminal domain-containing protein, partial [Pseudomonadota bacterium]